MTLEKSFSPVQDTLLQVIHERHQTRCAATLKSEMVWSMIVSGGDALTHQLTRERIPSNAH
ncbi:hypothetical protein EBR44_01435 [bacterium]|nr:hypothetical protein [bacterium]